MASLVPVMAHIDPQAKGLELSHLPIAAHIRKRLALDTVLLARMAPSASSRACRAVCCCQSLRFAMLESHRLLDSVAGWLDIRIPRIYAQSISSSLPFFLLLLFHFISQLDHRLHSTHDAVSREVLRDHSPGSRSF